MDGIACALQGRIAQDPEKRWTGQGTAMLNLSIAVADNKAAPDAPTEWVRVTLWGEKADELAPKLRKGVEVYVEGRLRLNTWQAADGQQRASLNVSAWTVQPLGQIGRRAPRPTHLQPVPRPTPQPDPQRRATVASRLGLDVEDLPA